MVKVQDEKCTVAETALQLHVEEKTVRNWIAKGQIPYMKIFGAVRIRQAVIDRILADAEIAYREKKGIRSARASAKTGVA